MQGLQIPTWLGVVLVLAAPLGAIVAGWLGHHTAAAAARRRDDKQWEREQSKEEHAWRRDAEQRLLESRSKVYGEALTSAHHWLDGMMAWSFFAFEKQGRAPAYQDVRTQLEARAREAFAAVELLGTPSISQLAQEALNRLLDLMERLDREESFPETRSEDPLQSKNAALSLVDLKQAMRADIGKLLRVDLD
ncbi:hypothetical protein [Amycolatopsis sp. NPDC051716]|uniref:hypothetical protein n=1 Tax=Amycolatopsis sp. NPDC051716 TaxID=3155804 RepID=UPI00341A272C